MYANLDMMTILLCCSYDVDYDVCVGLDSYVIMYMLEAIYVYLDGGLYVYVQI
mgnify:CR=1 FL=1